MSQPSLSMTEQRPRPPEGSAAMVPPPGGGEDSSRRSKRILGRTTIISGIGRAAAPAVPRQGVDIPISRLSADEEVAMAGQPVV